MGDDLLMVSDAQTHWNVSGDRILKYSVEMQHLGLHEHKVLSARETDILENKVEMQAKRWADKWDALEEKRLQREEKEANIEEAQRMTSDARSTLKELEDLLIHTLTVNDAVDWESLKKLAPFAIPLPSQPTKAAYHELPPEPQSEAEEFKPHFSLIDKLVSSRKRKKIASCENKFETALENWRAKISSLRSLNREIDEQHENNIEGWKEQVEKWEKQKASYQRKQEAFNSKIDRMKKSYLSCDPVAVTEYCDMVLNNSKYPDFFSKEFEIEFKGDTGVLIVEYQFPAEENLPSVKEVKYIASRHELKEYHISEAQKHVIYDGVLYQITLRTVHELLEADSANAIRAISFSGWVRSTNKATGLEENRCILSMHVAKDEFLVIALDKVEPKACFKKLKGVAASKLSALSAIQPILQIDRNDRRIVDGRPVVDGLDPSANIAAMDWEDFEHLIREVFEKEFSSSGGEVKVTQASRDGGVDAIAFDPDPIKGGKIVIQAKRYTNTVGVSAVRDLYGTVLNEGATKGILVTTADYGPDAYHFAKGKPLTLLNGGNLLHLLGKHGHHVRIDLIEAKKVLSDNNSG